VDVLTVWNSPCHTSIVREDNAGNNGSTFAGISSSLRHMRRIHSFHAYELRSPKYSGQAIAFGKNNTQQLDNLSSRETTPSE